MPPFLSISLTSTTNIIAIAEQTIAIIMDASHTKCQTQ